MTSRERVLYTVRHQEPDRVPFNFRLLDTMLPGFQSETMAPNGDYEEYFNHDLRRVWVHMPARPSDIPRSEWFPKSDNMAIKECAAQIGHLHKQGLAVFSGYVCGVFEEAKEWIGDEALLTIPYEDPDRLTNMLDRITDYKMELYGAYAQAGVDIVHIGDDLGTQNSLIMSPDQYREWYRPRHQQIIRHLRSIKPNVLIAFHCCGHVTPLLPDLIELGVDILEAVQPETMDIGELKRQYGRHITFWGAIGNQSVLARLKPDEIRKSIHQTLALMSPGGGYLASPCHTITEDIPWENIKAFVQAVQEYNNN